MGQFYSPPWLVFIFLSLEINYQDIFIEIYYYVTKY